MCHHTASTSFTATTTDDNAFVNFILTFVAISWNVSVNNLRLFS